MTHADDVAGLIEYARDRLLARLEGITDDEYLWEPVSGCWSVHERDGGWYVDLGADGTRWTTEPAPLTTIAWRMWHLGATPEPTWPPKGAVTGRQFIDGYFAPDWRESHRAVGTSAEAVALVRENWARLPQTVRGFGDAELAEVIGPIGEPYQDDTLLALLLHIADELVHHAAEVALLRDLYRAQT